MSRYDTPVRRYVLPLALVACSPVLPDTVLMPDGQVWNVARCRQHSACVIEAGQQCSRGYHEYREQHPGELVYRCKSKHDAAQ